jgi:hypothetical protein
MNIQSSPKLSIPQYWLKSDSDASDFTAYRPAFFVECSFKFHNLRAHIKHTEDRRYITWVPRGEGSPNWDHNPVPTIEDGGIWTGPQFEIPHLQEGFELGQTLFESHLESLVEDLSRTEKLRLWFNQNFDEFSNPGETRQKFIERLSDRAAGSIEDDLAQLISHVNLKLAQVRQSEERKGRKLQLPEAKLNSVITGRRNELLTSQGRLEHLFQSGERLVVTDDDKIESFAALDPENRELHETLERIEQETRRKLNDLCTGCIQQVSECDEFVIGLQPQQIKVTRSGILWVPVKN